MEVRGTPEPAQPSSTALEAFAKPEGAGRPAITLSVLHPEVLPAAGGAKAALLWLRADPRLSPGGSLPPGPQEEGRSRLEPGSGSLSA